MQIQGYSKTQAGFSILPFASLLTLMSRWAGGLADRLGPRLLLIVGPSLAGLGFFYMSFAGLTRGPGDYWTAFLPGDHAVRDRDGLHGGPPERQR